MNHPTQIRTPYCSKTSIFPLLLGLLVVGCSQTSENRPSPLRKASGKIGQANIEITYSSPAVRGREIWGELVEYDAIWRTGANDASIFATDQSLKMDTLLLPAGKYAIFTIPGQQSWKVVFNKEWDQWGAYQYDESLDVVSLWVKPQRSDSSAERMEFFLSDRALNFTWEYVMWQIPMTSSPK